MRVRLAAAAAAAEAEAAAAAVEEGSVEASGALLGGENRVREIE